MFLVKLSIIFRRLMFCIQLVVTILLLVLIFENLFKFPCIWPKQGIINTNGVCGIRLFMYICTGLCSNENQKIDNLRQLSVFDDPMVYVICILMIVGDLCYNKSISSEDLSGLKTVYQYCNHWWVVWGFLQILR